MVTKGQVLQALGGTPVISRVVVDDQDVRDIMHYMPKAHRAYGIMYDRFAQLFELDDEDMNVYDLCRALWQFCRDNFEYFEESEEDQRLSAPSTMLKRGYADCKGYSLFCAGVLDALKRRGWPIGWQFRYVPTSFWSVSIGHVFVVVDPNGQNIWIDPVLDTFNKKMFFWVRKDVRLNAAKVAGLNGYGRVGIAKQEQSLLDQLHEYTLGLVDAMTLSLNTGTFNTITKGVVQTAANYIPGVAIALKLLSAVGGVLNNAFGPGSLAARLVSDITSNLLLAPYAIIKTLLSPGTRTFDSDQYEGARLYYYYVEGNTKYKNSSFVSDTDVLPALKWFIDRTGVFISGDQHIKGLIAGLAQYESYHKANAYTTIDDDAVAPAVGVAQTYWNMSGAPGSWANTIGVFDEALGQIAIDLNESLEEVNAQVKAGLIANPAAANNILSSPVLWIGGGLVLGLLLTLTVSSGNKK